MLNTNRNTGSARRRARADGALLGLLISAAAFGVMPLSAATAAEEMTAAEAAVANALSLSPKGMQVVSERAGELSVEIEPVRERYQVGEPIQFRVRGDSDFYIYLYSISSETGEPKRIFPNVSERDNHYPRGRFYLIPGRHAGPDARFTADRAGTEEVVMVASRAPIDNPLFALEHDASQPTSAADFERLLSAKGLRIEHDARGRLRDTESDGYLLKRLELTVTDDGYQDRPAAEGPTTLIGTARGSYRLGESFDATFAATKAGWVHLYSVEPGGAVEKLDSRKVKANQLESAALRATAPHGLHKLVAIYSVKRQLDRATEATILGEHGEVFTPEDDEIAVAVHRIRVGR